MGEIEPGVRIEGLVFERELGRGAFASVWLARDVVLDRPVAVKLLRSVPGGAAAVDEKRVLAEARLVGRLKSPHIVTLHRVHRLPDGDGWMIEMEHVDAGSLEEALEDRVPMPAERARQIARGVVQALSVAHSQDVVHGDVKPANVLLGHDGAVKLADFGLASFLGDTSVAFSAPAGRIAGTPSYMAPEVAMGARATPASDLWSVGVVLYRMLSGRLPFEGPTIDALFVQIHHAALRELPGDIPSSLVRLATRCLAKKPEERPSSAEALAILDDATPPSEGRVSNSAAAPARPRLFGREQETARLDSALDDAARGQMCVVVVAGDAGVGKTAFLTEAAGTARRLGFHVLDAVATSLSGLVPPLLDAARRAIDGASRRKGGEVLRLSEEDLGSSASGIRRVLSDPDEARPVDRQAAAWAVEQIVRAVARRRPVAVLVDDAHHADGKDVRLLKDLAASLQGAPVAFVVACRRLDDGAEASGVHELLAFPGAVHMELGALSVEDCYRVVAESMPGLHVSTRVAERVLDVAEGNPLFALELMRHLVESGAAVVRGDVLEPGPHWEAADLPRRFHDVVALRLANLAEEDRALIDVAAVDGLNFDGEALAAVVERPLLTVLRRLQTLHRRGGLLTPRVEGYRFEHPVVQEVIYRDLAPDLRRELHRRLAETLESRAGKTRVEPERLGQHWEQGGRPDRAAPYLNRAALDAARRQEYLRAIDFATRSGLLPDGIAAETIHEHTDLLFALCGSYTDLGKAERAEEILERVRVVAEKLDDEQLALRTSVWREDTRFHAHGAEAVDVAAVERACAGLRPCQELGTAHYVVGSVAKWRGDLEEATRRLRRADETFQALDLPLLQNAAMHQLASVAFRDGRLREAEKLYAEAGSAIAAAGKRMNAAVAEVNRVLAAFASGRVEGLVPPLERSIRGLELVGAANHAAQAAVVLAQVRYAGGDTTGAEKTASDALAVVTRTGFTSGSAGARFEIGRIAAIRGDLDRAGTELTLAVEHARKAGDVETALRAAAYEVRRAAFGADRDAALERARACVDAARAPSAAVWRRSILLSIAECALFGLPSAGLDAAEELGHSPARGEDPVEMLAPVMLAAARAFRRADGSSSVLREAASLYVERPCGEWREERMVVAALLEADALRRDGRLDAAAATASEALQKATRLGHVWLQATLLRLLSHVEPRGDHPARLAELVSRAAGRMACATDRVRLARHWGLSSAAALESTDALSVDQ